MACQELLDAIASIDPVLCILDHYNIEMACETQIRKITSLLVFDDEFKAHDADIILNHSFIADAQRYISNTNSRIFAGDRYTLLNKDFLTSRSSFAPLQTLTDKKVLITLGGSDPLALSSRIKKALLHIDKSLQITIVTTSANARLGYLKIIEQELIINERDMASLMRRHDLIITSASSSLLEACALKKPFIAVKCASNQQETIHFLQTKNLANIIEKFSPASLKKALNFVQYRPNTLKRFFKEYNFKKSEVFKEIEDAYC
jgi:spore coat polysaccharide biosynthesis predicted glycosyltransferase SpsG